MTLCTGCNREVKHLDHAAWAKTKNERHGPQRLSLSHGIWEKKGIAITAHYCPVCDYFLPCLPGEDVKGIGRKSIPMIRQHLIAHIKEQ
jgi:hypothetical protein